MWLNNDGGGCWNVQVIVVVQKKKQKLKDKRKACIL